MSIRPVFISVDSYPFYREIHVELDWFQGFALSQKRKCETSLHLNFLNKYPSSNILEVSSASTNPLGYHLSAMHLFRKDEEGRSICCESEFQASRINKTENLGPLLHLMYEDGKTAKKEYQQVFGKNHSYHYLCGEYLIPAPDYHISLFYDYNYIKYLLDPMNKKVKNKLISGNYDAFSDIATTSLNSQARACAIFVGLYQAGLLDKVKTIEGYMEVMKTKLDGKSYGILSYVNAQIFNVELNHVNPVEIIKKTIDKQDVEKYFNNNYSSLSNSPKFVPII